MAIRIARASKGQNKFFRGLRFTVEEYGRSEISRKLFEIEISQRFGDRLVLRFLEGFFKFAVENVILYFLGLPGVAKLVFAALGLLLQDSSGVVYIHAGGAFGRHLVGQNNSKIGVDRQFRVAARTAYFNHARVLLLHAFILR